MEIPDEIIPGILIIISGFCIIYLLMNALRDLHCWFWKLTEISSSLKDISNQLYRMNELKEKE